MDNNAHGGDFDGAVGRTSCKGDEDDELDDCGEGDLVQLTFFKRHMTVLNDFFDENTKPEKDGVHSRPTLRPAYADKRSVQWPAFIVNLREELFEAICDSDFATYVHTK